MQTMLQKRTQQTWKRDNMYKKESNRDLCERWGDGTCATQMKIEEWMMWCVGQNRDKNYF